MALSAIRVDSGAGQSSSSIVLTGGHLAWVPLLVWVPLWLGLNTGPWVMKHVPIGVSEYFHYIRTVFPLVLLFLGSIVMLNHRQMSKVIWGPLKCWAVYGFAGLVSGWISSPKPLDASYWALVYLTAFVSITLFVQGKVTLHKAVYLNYVNWTLSAAFLAILVFVARESLFVDSRWGLTGYGVVNRIGSVGGMAMSRSSGLARLAAVPGVASFVFLWEAGGVRRLVWAVPFVLSVLLVYLMQSRGAILGLVFAVGFVMIFLGRRTRMIGATLIVVIGLLTYMESIPEKRVELEKERFYRGTSEERFYTLTGRTLVWKHAWQKILKAPILGYGPQSDRYVLKTHIHNTYLYALMQSGFIGAAAFVGGLVWTWALFFRAIVRRTADMLGQRTFLIQAGGILAFFTVRSIPEVCGAMFGVDFLVMLPILAYLTILDQHGRGLA